MTTEPIAAPAQSDKGPRVHRDSVLAMATAGVVAFVAIGLASRSILFQLAYFTTPAAYGFFAITYAAMHPRRRRRRASRVMMVLAAVPLALGVYTALQQRWSEVTLVTSLVAYGLGPIGVLVALFLELRSGPPTAADRERAGPVGWWRAAVLFACGLTSFAASGLGVILAFAVIPAVTLVALTAIHGCRGRAAQFAIATLIGFGLAWLGATWNEVRLDWSDPDAVAAWELAYGAYLDEPYRTAVVTGFPIHGIQVGRGPIEFLAPAKGLGILVANYLLCVTGAALLVLLVNRFRQPFLITIVAAISFVAGGYGGWKLLGPLS